MKRLKIMMLSLCLFAVVGGALAFKAKYADNICYTQVANGTTAAQCKTKICNLFRQGQVDEGASQLIYCTTPGTNCNSNTICAELPAVSLIGD